MDNSRSDRAEMELKGLALDSLPEAITLISPQGIMLYYNQAAAEILDRKPEYIGRDIHSHHHKPETNPKIDAMLQAFREGRTEPFRYETKPYGRTISVALAPVWQGGELLAVVQSVRSMADRP